MAGAWKIAVLVLAWQVFAAGGSSLRTRHADRRQTLHIAVERSLEREKIRLALLKTMPPMDINPATFRSFVEAIPTDSLLLFFSPTCPDCEKLMPQWSRVAGVFEDNQDLTILSVSDDAGKAPAPYRHDENPAVFFIPRGDAAHPVAFPMADLHEFVGLPETTGTDEDIVNKLVSFVRTHATTGNKAPQPTAAPPRPTASSLNELSESQAGALTARLLASLKAKEAAPLEEQMEIVYEPHYQMLPVVQFLKSPTGMIGPPLAEVAAKYLDGLPLARQWANQYAAQQDANYRSHGWHPSQEEEKKYFQDLLDYAIPLYARSIYFQRG